MWTACVFILLGGFRCYFFSILDRPMKILYLPWKRDVGKRVMNDNQYHLPLFLTGLKCQLKHAFRGVSVQSILLEVN